MIEAAIVLPVFLTFILAFVTWIQIALIDTALQSAASETTKQIAAHYAILDPMQQKTQDVWLEGKQKLLSSMPEDWQSIVDQIESSIPASAEADVISKLTGTMFMPLAQLLCDRYADGSLLKKEQLTISQLEMPQQMGRSPYISLQVQYRYSLVIPFIERTLLLEKTATERVWMGGSPAHVSY